MDVFRNIKSTPNREAGSNPMPSELFNYYIIEAQGACLHNIVVSFTLGYGVAGDPRATRCFTVRQKSLPWAMAGVE
jgi:hypothetical protein